MALSAPPAPAEAVAQLAVAGLGPLRIEIDGLPVPFRAGRRERGVFQYLLMHRRRPVAREELTEVFWPGSSPSHGRNNLNVSIWGLRNRLREPLGGRSVCVFDGGAYRLDPSLVVHVDVEELERLAAAARVRRRAGDIEGAAADLRAAVALYAGDLFEEDRYEAWIDPFRRDLADTHLATHHRPRRVRAPAGRHRDRHRPVPSRSRPRARARGPPPAVDAVLRPGRPALPGAPAARPLRRGDAPLPRRRAGPPRRWRSASGFAGASPLPSRRRRRGEPEAHRIRDPCGLGPVPDLLGAAADPVPSRGPGMGVRLLLRVPRAWERFSSRPARPLSPRAGAIPGPGVRHPPDAGA